MKHSLIQIMTACFAAALLFSCTAPQPEETISDMLDEPVILSAGFENGGESGTRTSLSINDEGSRVQVLWTAGDTFRMMRGSQYTDFVTQDSGPAAVFQAQWAPAGSGICCSFYPASRFVTRGNVNGESVYVMSFPSVQTAVAGGVQEGLNLAVATSQQPTDDLTFRNLLCYIRFRIGGAAASQVTSVILDAGKCIAGDFTIYGMSEGQPRTSYNLIWSNQVEPRASTIRLDGPFVAGQDYYLALTPVTLDEGFSLFFKDAQGRLIRKHSTLNLTMERSTVYDFGTIQIGDDFETAANFWEDGHLYKPASTSVSRPIDICVVPEGYRAEELPTYVEQAHSAIDFLFETEPYKTYKDYFNAYVLEVPSEQSGGGVSDGNGHLAAPHDSYFGIRWGADQYQDMTALADVVWSFVSRNCPSIQNGSRTIQEVMTLMLVNDERYGGRCWSVSDGCAYAMCPINGGRHADWPISTSGYIANGNNGPEDGARSVRESDYADIGHSGGDWRNTAVHEFGGHAFGRLADEYWGAGYQPSPTPRSSYDWPVPFGLNVTHLKDNPFWKEALLDNQATLVASNPDYGRVGVFQGADNYIFNKWRSEKISCMIDNRCYFSAWQRILIVKRIKELAGETFSLDDFFSRDITTDPVRVSQHIGTSGVRARVNAQGPLQEMAPPAAPELVEGHIVPLIQYR